MRVCVILRNLICILTYYNVKRTPNADTGDRISNGDMACTKNCVSSAENKMCTQNANVSLTRVEFAVDVLRSSPEATELDPPQRCPPPPLQANYHHPAGA